MLIQIAKYGLFGIIATLIHLVTAWSLVYLFDSSFFYANLSAFLLAFISSYIFQTLYVFESHFEINKLVKFFLVQFGVFLLSYAATNLFLLTNQYLQTLLLVVIMPLLSFFVHKLWTFKRL